MRKALTILLLITSGCSIIRNIPERKGINENIEGNAFISSIIKNNLSSNDFFIKSGEIHLKTESESRRFLFTVKHKVPDIYLISLRSTIGLEGARIFITSDTVLINDRLKGRVLYGRPSAIAKIIGFPAEFIELTFGDIMGDIEDLKNKSEILNRNVIISQYKKGMTGKSKIGMRERKLVEAEWNKGPGTQSITFYYSKFKKGSVVYPTLIEMKSSGEFISAKIRIKNLETPWNGEVEFIPGKDYNKEELR